MFECNIASTLSSISSILYLAWLMNITVCFFPKSKFHCLVCLPSYCHFHPDCWFSNHFSANPPSIASLHFPGPRSISLLQASAYLYPLWGHWPFFNQRISKSYIWCLVHFNISFWELRNYGIWRSHIALHFHVSCVAVLWFMSDVDLDVSSILILGSLVQQSTLLKTSISSTTQRQKHTWHQCKVMTVALINTYQWVAKLMWNVLWVENYSREMQKW